MRGFIKKTTALSIAVALTAFSAGVYLFPLSAFAACGSGYSFCRTLTINHLKVPSTQTNFTVLATTTDTTLKVVGSGGNIQNTTTFNGQTVPADMVFSSTADCSTLMSWDFESYVTTTGEIEVWVLVPSLSSSVDTSIYMCYGKSSVSTYQGGSVGAAWNSNYKSIWHLPNGSTLAAQDATTNGNNGTITGAVAGIGQIDGGADVTAAESNVTKASATGLPVNTTDHFTVQGWQRSTSYVSLSQLFGFGFALPTSLGGGGAGRYLLEFNNDYYFWGINADWDTAVAFDSDSKFHSWAFVWDGTTLVFYRDGVSAASRSGLPTGMTTADVNIIVGSHHSSGSNPATIVDEARISNIDRSADWITTEYNNQSAVATFMTIGTQQTGGTTQTVFHKVVFNNGVKATFNQGTTIIQ